MNYDEKISALLLMYIIALEHEPHETRPFTEVKNWVLDMANREVKMRTSPTKELFEEAYQRGRADAINEMVDLINEMPTYTVDGVLMPMPIEMIAEKVKEKK